jgi:hypothetical protein
LSRSQKEWKNLKSTEAKTKTSEEESKVNRNKNRREIIKEERNRKYCLKEF